MHACTGNYRLQVHIRDTKVLLCACQVPNDAVLTCDTAFKDFSEKDLLDPSKDKTVRAQLVKSNFH